MSTHFQADYGGFLDLYASSIMGRVVLSRRGRRRSLQAAIAVALGSLAVVGVIRWLPWPMTTAAGAFWVWAERASWVTGVIGLLVALAAMRAPARYPVEPRGRPINGQPVLRGGEVLAPGLVSMEAGHLSWPVRGRDDLIERLISAMRTGQPSRVWVLTGMGGTGKTTIARAVAQYAAQAGVTTWWVSAATTTDLWTGMREVATHLGGRDSELDGAWAGAQSAPDLLWRLLGAVRGRWLLIIDNADDPGILAASRSPLALGTGWLRPVAAGRGLVVVTSRDGDQDVWGPWCQLQPVGMLAPTDAAQVLLDHAGDCVGDLTQAEALALRLGGLPLALHLSGAFLRDVADSPWPGPAATFDEYRMALDAGRVDPMSPATEFRALSAHGVVGRSWDMSLDLLDRRGMTKARPLLRLLSGLSDADVPYQVLLDPDTLATTSLFEGIDGAELWRVLQALERLSLIERRPAPLPVTEVVRIHPLVRDASWRHAARDRDALVALATELLHHAVDREHRRAASNDPDRWPMWQSMAPHVMHVLRLVTASPTPTEVAVQAAHAGHLTARRLYARGLYGQAESAYRAVLEVRRRVVGPDAADTLAARHDLARVLHDRGMYQDAEDELRAVLTSRCGVLGEEHPHTVATRHNLARALHNRGQYAAAEAQYRSALAARRRILGHEHRQTLSTRHQLARVLHNRGRLAQAEAEGREIYDTEQRVLGPEHPDTLITAHQLAVVLHGRGRYGEALDMYQAVYESQKRVVGEHHPDTLTTLHNIHRVLLNLGRFDEQLAGYPALINARRDVLGEEHPATLTSSNNYAVALHAAGRLAEAEAVARAVVEAYRRVYGEDHPDVLAPFDTLAAILHDQGRLVEAESEYQRLLPLGVGVLGAEHSWTFIVRHQLASVHVSMGRYEQAEAEIREVLADQERVLGAESSDALTSRHSLARVLCLQGRYDHADDEYRAIIATRTETLGDDLLNLLVVRADRTLVLARTGAHHEAEKQVRSVLAEQVRMLGSQHPDVIATRAILLEVLAIGGQPRRARAEARGILFASRRLFGEDHPFTRFIRAAVDHNIDWSDTTRPRPTCRTSDVFSNAVSEINMPQHRHDDE